MAESELSQTYHLPSNLASNYKYLSNANHRIADVDDAANFRELQSAFKIVGFTQDEVRNVLSVIAAILLIGNIEFVSERAEQASFASDVIQLCSLLGVTSEDFQEAVLRPKSKAGREWIINYKNASQARFILNALSRTLYEQLFAYIVQRINKSLNHHGSMGGNFFIGLLDIAGFEIFEHNSFEQLCINYTNEKLQQFFNHHMFVLEQTEYVKENIQWDYVDYGKDLQSTIDLIEQRISPPGILPLLEEESILSNSTDDTFFQKLITSWEGKSDRFKRSKLLNSFVLRHYAGTVEYSIDGWLSKNKDPLSENLSNVLVNSKNELVSSFFAVPNNEVEQQKVGASSGGRNNKTLRTTSGRHREQLNSLLSQLNLSHPHFVRCIIPNSNKRPKEFDRELILNQLRCNGVLEGIRIAREGYPNRIFFGEFFSRYKILNSGPVQFVIGDDRRNCEIILSSLSFVDPAMYKVGRTKLFFKDGVLGRLEHKKERKILEIIDQLLAYRRGKMVRNEVTGELRRLRSAKVIGTVFDTYIKLMDDPWYNLYIKVKPLLSTTEDIVRNRKFSDQIKALEEKLREKDALYEDLAKQKSAADEQLKHVQALYKQKSEKLKISETALKNIEEKNGQLQTELSEAANTKEKLNDERLEILERLNRASAEIARLTQSSKEQASSEESVKFLRDKNMELSDKLDKLESERVHSTNEISRLKRQLSSSARDLNSKLITLERSCNVAKERLQALLDENAELRSQLGSSREECTTLSKQMRAKAEELRSATEIVNKYEAQISTLFSERNNLQRERDQYMNDVRTLRSKVETLNEQRQSRQSRQSSLRIQFEDDCMDNTQGSKEWADQLAEKHTQFTNMASGVRVVNRDMLIGGYDSGSSLTRGSGENSQLSQLQRAFEKERAEKEGILSKLRVTETRLASVSFECQTVRSQVRKLKSLLRNSNIPGDIGPAGMKNLPATKTLRPQSTIGFESNGSNTSLSEEQPDDSTETLKYYKQKCESGERRIRDLESKLSQLVLRDRTNLPSTPNTSNKTDDELRAQRMDNFRLQEILHETNKKVNLLTSEIKQYTLKENLLNENINRLQRELATTKNQKELVSEQFKRQKEQLETCLSDLHSNEIQLKDCVRMLRQAEDDVKNMGGMLDGLRTQIKEKDKLIWDVESQRSDLEQQLQDTSLELKREKELNEMLTSDIDHWKNQFQTTKNNSRYIKNIEQLKNELDASMRNETELNKQVATLKYKFEMANNDSETKINDLLQQVQHYTHLVEVLSNERDSAEMSEKELNGKYAKLTKERDDLSNKVNALIKEKENLTNEFEKLEKKLSETIAGNEAYQQQTSDMSGEIQTLKEALQLQKGQVGRNEELVRKLQDDISSYRDKFNTEKQKSIDLFEENQTLQKVNKSMDGKIQELQTRLGDTTERDAWLTKIQELEKMVAEEAKLKYEEIKRTKQQERVIKDLLQKNSQQADVINAANEDRVKFESNILSYNNQIADLEKLISTQELNLKKAERESSSYRSRVDELERQLQLWRNQGSSGSLHHFTDTSPTKYIAGEVTS